MSIEKLPVLGCCDCVPGPPPNIQSLFSILGIETWIVFGFQTSSGVYRTADLVKRFLNGSPAQSEQFDGHIRYQSVGGYHRIEESLISGTSEFPARDVQVVSSGETSLTSTWKSGGADYFEVVVTLSNPINIRDCAELARTICDSRSLTAYECFVVSPNVPQGTYGSRIVLSIDDNGVIQEGTTGQNIARSLERCLEGEYTASWFDFVLRPVDNESFDRFTTGVYAAALKTKICTPFQWCRSDCGDNTSGGTVPAYSMTCNCQPYTVQGPGILYFEVPTFRTGVKAGIASWEFPGWNLPECVVAPPP